MKFEKRSGDEAETPSSAPEETPSTGKKPVVIYIMILFIVAFLLMALSFLMHQRSNSEVLGELQDSVTAMQEVQATQDALLAEVKKLADDSAVHGILVQLPLPEHIDEQKVIYSISPLKDVDAFHPINVGKIMIGDYDFLPCTPAGVMELIDSTGTDLDGKNCVVVGRSNIVGKPMAMLLLHRNATVTICHSHTKNLKEVCASADILVSAVGKAHFITADMVKEGAIVIDVGMNHDENGKLCGDVEFAEVEPKASYITPVPGGVGPMTITMLMKNTLRAAEMKQK